MEAAIGADEGRGRANSFYLRGNEWFCRTNLQSDIVIEVEGTLFHLHKFPLVSKCGKIARIVEGFQNVEDELHASLNEFPGGSDGFLIAATFCYEGKAALKPESILMIYLAADFLEMTEKYGEDNLLVQAENFIHRVILRSWDDCLIALRSFQSRGLGFENLSIVQRCLNAVSEMACRDPSLVRKPGMFGVLQSHSGSILWNGINTGAKIRSTFSDWWFEDVSFLSFPMLKKLIETINIRRISSLNLTGMLVFYATKHLPGLDRWMNRHGSRKRIPNLSIDSASLDQKVLIENIAELLPEKKGKSYCFFLLGLLRFAMILDVDSSCKDSLEKKIGSQLELVTLDGLFIPNFSESDNLYDTDCVERIIRHFLSYQATPFTESSSHPAIQHPAGFWNKAAKLVDGYLAEIASDVNLKPQKMHSLLEIFPDNSRELHDGIYRAVDIYFKVYIVPSVQIMIFSRYLHLIPSPLQEHPWLQEVDKEQISRAINFSKLSAEACVHASQNGRLPLRAVLQVLFFEQQHLRSALSRLNLFNHGTLNADSDEIIVDGELVDMKVDMEHIQSKVRGLETQFMSMRYDMGKKMSR